MKTMTKILYICTVTLFMAFMLFNTFVASKTNDFSEANIEETTFTVENEEIDAIKTNSSNATKTNDWDKFIEAIIWKESRGNASAIGDNGRAVGVLQIHPIMVKEANRILAMRKSDKVYNFDDRYDREKSIEIFNIVQSFHNKERDFDRALQIWNKNHPESYKTLIMEKYNELID